jgi:putative endonuclease
VDIIVKIHLKIILLNKMSETNYIVYLLTNTCNNCTYVGSTNNPERRIRQHNGELVGGAKYTMIKRQTGNWQFYGQIKNLERREALSIEKRIQKKHRKSSGKTPLERRLNAIQVILQDYNNIIFEKLI